jgi:hemoglobin
MTYGTGDASFQAAGGRGGLAKLVDAFYDAMEVAPEAAGVRAMHPPDLAMSREKLKTFLAAWLGGPNEYRARFGPISIPGVHAHLAISEVERDAWLFCMQRAVDAQPWADDFKAYFLRAIAVPAERVRVASQARAALSAS